MDWNFDSNSLEDDRSDAEKVRARQIKILDDSVTGEGTRVSKLCKDAIKARERLFGAMQSWDEEEIWNEDTAEVSISLLRPDEGSYLLGSLDKVQLAEIDDCMPVLLVHNAVPLL